MIYLPLNYLCATAAKRPKIDAAPINTQGASQPTAEDLQQQVRVAIPELSEVDDLLEVRSLLQRRISSSNICDATNYVLAAQANEKLIEDIDKHQISGKRKDLSTAQKLIVELNQNTHRIVEVYEELKQECAKLGHGGGD